MSGRWKTRTSCRSIGSSSTASGSPTAGRGGDTSRIAILDDYQGVVLALPYWSRLDGRVRLDVYDVEPLPAGHPLLALDNVVLSPHAGYVTREAYDEFFRQVVENIESYLDGAIPARALNATVLARR